MANFPRTSRKFVLSASLTPTGTYMLSNPGGRSVGTHAIHIVNTGSLVASIVVSARSMVPDADTDAVPFVGTVYRKLWLNGAAGDGSLVAVPITDTSNILVPSSGQVIALVITFTSGTGAVYWTPLEGPSVI